MGSRSASAAAFSIETSPSCSPLRVPVFRRLSLGKLETRQDWPEEKSPATKWSRGVASSACPVVEAEITWTPEPKDRLTAAEKGANRSPSAARPSIRKFNCSRRLYPSSCADPLVETSLNIAVEIEAGSVRSAAAAREGDTLGKSQDISSSLSTSEWSEQDLIPSSLKEEPNISESEVSRISSQNSSPQSIKTLEHVSSNDEFVENSLTSSKEPSSSGGIDPCQNVSGSDTESFSEIVQLSEDETLNDPTPVALPSLPLDSIGQAALELVSPRQACRRTRRRKLVKGGFAEQFQHWANQQNSHLNIWLYRLRSLNSGKAPAGTTVVYKLRYIQREFNRVQCFCDVCMDDQSSCAIVVFDENIFSQYDLKPGDSFTLLPPYSRGINYPGNHWPIVVGPLFVQPLSTD